MATIRDNDTRYAEFMRIIDGDSFQCRIQALPHVRPRVEIVANVITHNWTVIGLTDDERRAMRRSFEDHLMHAGRIDLQIRGMSHERVVASVWVDDELLTGLLTHELLAMRGAGGAEPGAAGG